MNTVIEFISNTHRLRLAFWLVAIILIISAGFTMDKIVHTDWRIFPSLILPSLVPFMFFLIPLDITMNIIQKSSIPNDDNPKNINAINQYKYTIITNIALMLLILLAWMPFIRSLS